jgi:hypothetical protein
MARFILFQAIIFWILAAGFDWAEKAKVTVERGDFRGRGGDNP